MKSIAWSLTMLGALSLIVACGDDSGDDDEGSSGDAGEQEEPDLPDVDCDAQDIPTFEEVAAFDKCTTCHSSELSGAERNGAPADDNWDTYEEAMEHADEIAHEVFEGEMPPEGSGMTLTATEEEELYLWALCGTPE
jgi:cytochrome c5